MKLERFLLDEWFDESLHPEPRWDLGASTGPHWTLGELLELASDDERAALENTTIAYSVGQGAEDLREAIAGWYGVSADDVVAVTGASEALHIIYFTAFVPGANVVVPAPNFPPISAVPRGLGYEVRTYGLRAERSFEVDVDEVSSLIDERTRVVVVNTPNNPTGAVIAEAAMAAIHDAARRVGARFVCDEVYHPIYFDTPQPSGVSLPEATVVGDMSKSFSLSGLRLGWVIERDAAERTHYTRARMYFTATNNPLAERLSVLALRNADTIVGRTQAVARRNLEALSAFMTDHAGHLQWVRPAGGTVCFPWLTNGGDSRSLCLALRDAGVVVVPGDAFGQPAHIRIGFGGASDIDGALAAMAAVVARVPVRPPRHL